MATGLFVVGMAGSLLRPGVADAAVGINQQINFQGRLLNAAGAVVADGTYNMRFKIYCDGDGVTGGADPGSCTAHATNEHLMWTETHQNSASQGVVVKNGYFSVQLGNITSLSSVDFNQTTLWLSMAVTTNGTDTGGSPTYDTEMSPFRRLSSAAYAMQAQSCVTCILQAPTSTAQNTITPTTNSVVGLTVNATSGTAAQAVVVNQTQAADAVNINVSNASGTATNGLTVDKSGAGTLSNGIQISRSAGTLSTGLLFSGAIGTEIKLQNGESVANGTNGTISLASDSGALTLNLANAATSATLTNATGNLILDSASNTIGVAASDTTLQRTASGNFTLDLNDSSTTKLLVTNSGAGAGVVSAKTGFQIGGASATGGHFLRGDGTNFVDGTIQASDIPDLGSTYIKNQTSSQTGNFNITSGAAGSIAAQIQGAASATAAVMLVKGGSSPGTNADLVQFATSSATVGKIDNAGNHLAVGAATGTTATTSGTGTNTTTVTLTGSAFANNDVIFIDNAGQDYYTRIVSGGGTATLTVSPAVTFENARTVTKYTVQNIGATATDYTTQANRYFQGYFLGGVVTGAGSTTLSDGRLTSTGRLNFNATDVSIQNTANSETALQVLNASGLSEVNVNTLNSTNQIMNGDFELGYTDGWSIRGTAINLALSTTGSPVYGKYSLHVTTNSAAGNGLQYKVGLKPSTAYTFSLWARIAAGSNGNFTMGRADNGSDTTCTTLTSTPTTTWAKYSCTFTTGSTIGPNANVYIIDSNTSSDDLYIDAVSLVPAEGSTATAAFVGTALQVEPYYNNIVINALNNGEIQPWQTSPNSLPQSLSRPAVATYNGYMYVAGGGQISDGGATVQSTVYYSKLGANGAPGSFTATSTLAQAVSSAGLVAVNGYLYTVGGKTNTNENTGVSTVQRAKINVDGTVGTWVRTTSALPAVRNDAGVFTYNGYIYVAGGWDGTTSLTNTLYYGKVQPNGDITSWTANATSLGTAVPGYATAGPVVGAANGYMYVMGATTGSQTVVYGKLNADGSVSSMGATNSLPVSMADTGGVISNGYFYILGGWDNSAIVSTVYYAPIQSDGTLGDWVTSTSPLPAARENHRSVVANGYIYVVGGETTSVQSSVLYTSGARVKVGGSVDLVGLGGENLSEGGGGGELTAGNTNVVGSLKVQDAAAFARNVSIGGALMVGGTEVIAAASGQTTDMFQLQDSTGSNIFRLDPNANLESIGQFSNGYGGLGQFGNLIQCSELFDTTGCTGTDWTTAGTLNVTANSTAAPDGQTTADTLAAATSGADINMVSATAPTNANYTFSVWLKTSSGTQQADLRIDGSTTGTGTANRVTVTTTWQRFSVTQNTNGFTGFIKPRIFPGTTASTGTVIGWGAQLTLSSSPQVYVRTTNSTVAANRGIVSNGGAFISSIDQNDIPLVVQAAPSQTADLLQLQDSSGLINGAFNSAGNQLTLGRVAGSGTVTQGKLVLSDGTTSNFSGTLQLAGAITAGGSITYTLPIATSTAQTICTSVASSCGGATGAYVALQGSTPGTQQTGNVNLSGRGLFATGVGINNTASANKLNINTITTTNTATTNAAALIASGGTGNVGLVIQGAASRTVPLGEFQNSDGTAIFAIGSSGSDNVYSSSRMQAFGGFDIVNNSSTQGDISKTQIAGTGGVTANDVVVLVNDGGNARVIKTTTARDPRVYGVANATATNGNDVNVSLAGNYTVTATTAAVAIGDQLVTSTTSGQVMTDNNATTGVLGIATTAKGAGSAGLVGVMLRPVGGVVNPNLQGGNLTTTGSLSAGTLVVSGTLASTASQASLTVTNSPTAGGTQTALSQTITNSPTSSANTAIGYSTTLSDATTLANTLQGMKIVINDTASSAKTVQGLMIDLSGSTNANSGQLATGILVKGAANTTSGVVNLLMNLQDSTGASLFKVANTGAVTVVAKNVNGGGGGDTALTVTGGTPLSNNGGGVGLSVTGGGGGSSSSNPGGAGGDGLRANGGVGGNNTGGTNNGGQGGGIDLKGGNGGTSSALTGGQGGGVVLTGGNGGVSTSGTGGAGGVIQLIAGNGATGGGGGAAGTITLTAGQNSANTARGAVTVVGDLIGDNNFNSTTAFVVQNASNQAVLTADTSAGAVNIGASSALTGALKFFNSGNANAFAIQAAASGAAQTWTLPSTTPTSGNCLTSSTTGAAVTLAWNSCGGGGGTLQTAYAAGTGSTTPHIAVSTTKLGVTIQNSVTNTIGSTGELFGVHATAANDNTIGTSLFQVRADGKVAVGNVTPTAILHAQAPNGSAAVGVDAANFTGGNGASVATGTGFNGGAGLIVQGGAGGDSTTQADQNGGVGGGATITGGQGGSGNGTGFGGTGGTITLQAGAGGINDGSGGDVILRAGQRNGSGSAGKVIVRPVDTNSGTAFEVQNSSSTQAFSVSVGASAAPTVTITGITGQTSGGNFAIQSSSYNHSAASQTGSVATISVTDATTLATASAATTTNALLLNSTLNVTGTGSGTKTLNVVTVGAPTLTACSATNTCVWDGATVTNTASSLTNLTQNAFNVSAVGVSGGSLNGVNIGGITAAGGTERAINIGSGWDAALVVGGTTVINGSGVVQVAAGGTGLTSYTTGDLLVATAGTTLGKIAAVGTGSCLISQGVSTAPIWGACGGGSVRLDQILAANTTATIANGANAITWNWQLTAAGSGHIIGETAASTGGNTSTNDQSLLQVTTLSGSTAAPLKITNGGNGNVVINNTSSGSFLVQNSGTNTIQTNSLGDVYLGKQDAGRYVTIGTGVSGNKVPTLLMLDQRGVTSDPSFFEGALYYNAFNQKLRCGEGAAWVDCVGASKALDNLASVNINTKLLFNSSLTTAGMAFTASAASANDLTLTAQTATAGAGGDIIINGGNTVAAGTNGGVTIDTGSGATTANGAINLGTVNARNITIGNATGTAKTIINAGVLTTTNNNSGVIIGGGYSTSDTATVGLTLDSQNNFADPASTCSASVNNGTLYYNNKSTSIRGCINGGWEDLTSTGGLGILTFGVVPDSGTTAGDMAGVGGLSSSPCKVTWASATSVNIAPCTVYSAGRKVIVPSTTLNTNSGAGFPHANIPASNYNNICIVSGAPQFMSTSGNATEATSALLPAFSANNPTECIATVRASGTAGNVGNIWDTRTFTNTVKEFATINSAAVPGYVVIGTTTMGVAQTTATAATGPIRGVVVASNATAATTSINGIIAVRGPAYAKFLAGGTATINNLLQTTTTAGYSTSVAFAAGNTTNYAMGGPLMTSISTSCTTQNTFASACQYAALVDFGPAR